MFTQGMVYEALFCICRYYKQRDSESIAKFIHLRRRNMIIPTSRIIPSYENRSRVPVTTLHYSIYQRNSTLLAFLNILGRMLRLGGIYPNNTGEVFVSKIRKKLLLWYDVNMLVFFLK